MSMSITATPDPKIVREIARKFLTDRHMTPGDVKASIRDHVAPDADDETFTVWWNAIDADVRKGKVETVATWPDEQPAAEQDDADIAAELVSTKNALNAAYRERAHLVALLATWYPSHIGYNDPDAPDWAVVTAELDTGQACWHIAADDMDLFGHVLQTPRYARGWDGHTTEEKYRRIRELAEQNAASGEVCMSMRTGLSRAEQDGDVRAVAAFFASDKLGPAMAALHDHFADRIAAAATRDAKEAL